MNKTTVLNVLQFYANTYQWDRKESKANAQKRLSECLEQAKSNQPVEETTNE